MPTEERIEEYVQVCLDYPTLRGKNTIVTLVAIGCAESSLDNMAVGRNDLNGTENKDRVVGGHDINFHYSLGLGWLQHDSGWLFLDEVINKVPWSVETIRQDPKESLRLLFARPGFVLYNTDEITYIDFKKWAVWPKKSHKYMAQVEEVYDRLAAKV